MGTVNTILVSAQNMPAAQTTFYTCPASTTALIDKFGIMNTTAGPITVSVNLVAASGAAAATNLIVTRQIAAAATYNFPEVVGHVLATGQLISCIAGATGCTIRVSGRELS